MPHPLIPKSSIRMIALTICFCRNHVGLLPWTRSFDSRARVCQGGKKYERGRKFNSRTWIKHWKTTVGSSFKNLTCDWTCCWLWGDSDVSSWASKTFYRWKASREKWWSSSINWMLLFNHLQSRMYFYRFNGGRVSLANSTPIGTHPDAIFRLECAATQFYEFFDMTKKVLGVTISRVDIISLTKQAADMGAMFWHFVHTDASTSITDIVIRGLLERREYKEYAKEIITTWDEISPKILKLRHFGASFGILQFGERYRQYVFETSEIMKLVKFQNCRRLGRIVTSYSRVSNILNKPARSSTRRRA